MITHQLALLKREIWEHRSIWVTPAAISIIVTLGLIAGLVFASKFSAELDMAIFGAQNLVGNPERNVALTGFFLGTSWVFIIALAILTVFYCLDSLYAERKDKSIYFWRSLPVIPARDPVSLNSPAPLRAATKTAWAPPRLAGESDPASRAAGLLSRSLSRSLSRKPPRSSG